MRSCTLRIIEMLPTIAFSLSRYGVICMQNFHELKKEPAAEWEQHDGIFLLSSFDNHHWIAIPRFQLN